MANKFKDRRKTYFIKKRFQRNFIIKFCVLVVIGSIISGAIIYSVSKSTLTTTFENSRLRIKSTADFILPAVLLASVFVVVFIGLAAVAVTLFTSHRIAGPLYRIEQDVEEIARGDLKKRFNLRRTDEIKVLAENLDQMTQFFRNNIKNLKRQLLELELALEQSKKLPAGLKEKLNNLKNTLSRFNT